MHLGEIEALLEDDRCRAQLARLILPETAPAQPDPAACDWRFVETPDGLLRDYVVSTGGHVLSLPRYRRYRPASGSSRVAHRKFQPGRFLRPGRHPEGFRTVVLYRDGRKEPFYVHQLVAWTFLGPQPPGHVIRHRDGNPGNNTADNLEYGPASPRLHAGVAGSVRDRERQLRQAVREALDGRRDVHRVLGEVLDYLTEKCEA